ARRTCKPQGVDADSELSEIAALLAEHLRAEIDLGLRDLPDLSGSLGEGALDAATDTAEPVTAAPEPRLAERVPPPTLPAGGRGAEPVLVGGPSGARTGGGMTSAAPAAPSDARARLAVLADEAASCTRCGLHAGRTKSVFARGNPDGPV